MIDDNMVHKARLHWVIFFWPVAILIALIGIAIAYVQFQMFAAIAIVIILIWLALTIITYQYSYLIIKSNQIILCRGFFIRETIGIPINKIESVDIRQNILGSILHYGSLVITGSGGTRQMIDFLNEPLTCRRYIEQLLANSSASIN